MPYIPQDNAATLRTVALRLRKNGISTRVLLDEVYRRKDGGHVIFGRSTFDKFVKGGNCRNVTELGKIWDYVLKNYKEYFEDGELPGELKSVSIPAQEAAALMPVALAGFFNQGHGMTALQKALAGEYVMWRRDYEPSRAMQGGIRVSKLTLTPEGSGLQIVEQQVRGTMRGVATYVQRDVGYVFSHRDYIYWLTKEEETCVKLAVITLTVPRIGDNAEKMLLNPETNMYLELMRGHMAAFSRTRRYPKARIYCRPEKLVGDVTYGLIPVDEITDGRAKEYILLDFSDEKQ